MDVPFHLIRCRSKQEREEGISAAALEAKERTLFELPQWAGVRREFVGTASLRARLSDLLLDRVREEMPKVSQEIGLRFAKAKDALYGLGADCSTEAACRRVLFETFTRFGQILKESSAGNYVRKELREDDMHLRSNLRSLQAKFNQEMLALNSEPKDFAAGDLIWLESKAFAVRAPEEDSVPPLGLRTENYIGPTGSGFYFIADDPKSRDLSPSYQTIAVRSTRDKDADIAEVTVKKKFLLQRNDPALSRLMGRACAFRGEELPGVLNWNVLKGLIIESVLGKTKC
jgi:hypothetical protein